jgi:hypothetical protein
MKNLLILGARVIFVMLSCVGHSAWAQPLDRNLPKMQLEDQNGLTMVIDDLKIAKPYVIAVIDKNLASAQSVVDVLKMPNFDGDGLIIIVLKPSIDSKNDKGISTLVAHKEALPKAVWLQGTVNSVVQPLKLSATPVFLGVSGSQQIIWRTVGMPKPAEKLTQQIKAWITPPSLQR